MLKLLLEDYGGFGNCYYCVGVQVVDALEYVLEHLMLGRCINAKLFAVSSATPPPVCHRRVSNTTCWTNMYLPDVGLELMFVRFCCSSSALSGPQREGGPFDSRPRARGAGQQDRAGLHIK